MISKRKAAFGILIWLLILGGFVALTGINEFLSTLETITAAEMGIILLPIAASVLLMGSTLYILARDLRLGISWVEAIFLNTSISLAHNLTPFGQAGGAPVGAAVLSDRSGQPYEKCLAAISMKDMISFVPTLVIFLIGGPYLMVYDQSLPPEMRPLFGVFAILVVIALGAVAAVRRYPTALKNHLARLATGANRATSRLPLLPSITEGEVRHRVDNFSLALGEIATNRVTLLLASGFTISAFVAQGTLLWLTLQAVGVDIPIMLAIFIVPVSLFAAGLPLPGGSGGVEAVQIIIIGGLASAATGPTTVAVVLSRGLVYWTPIVLGSISLVVFQLQGLSKHA
jgi:uncharacterized protein (TIRG00374 family)